MELKELQILAKPYLENVDVILATIDGQFFYERDLLYALAHVGGKKEEVFRIEKNSLLEEPKVEVKETIDIKVDEEPKVEVKVNKHHKKK